MNYQKIEFASFLQELNKLNKPQWGANNEGNLVVGSCRGKNKGGSFSKNRGVAEVSLENWPGRPTNLGRYLWSNPTGRAT
jgi:hypothetical protein